MVSSKELKKMILKDLVEWGMDPAASFYRVKELGAKTYGSVEDYYFHDKSSEPKGSVIGLYSFTDEDYREIKQEFINEVKRTPQDWKIEKEGEMTLVRHKSGRKHYKEGFVSKEKDKLADKGWLEIESALNNQHQEDVPLIPSKGQQAQQEQPPKEIKYMGHIYHRGSKF